MATIERWADLVGGPSRKRKALPLLDSMIAASALEHDLTVATRNVRDFDKAGVKVVDPFVDAVCGDFVAVPTSMSIGAVNLPCR